MQFGSAVSRRRKSPRLDTGGPSTQVRRDAAPPVGDRTGKSDPHLSTILAIAKALGRVPPGQLLGATNGVSPAALEVARLFDGALDEVKEGVAKILRATAGRPRRS